MLQDIIGTRWTPKGIYSAGTIIVTAKIAIEPCDMIHMQMGKEKMIDFTNLREV
jgi:hypothetical protein